MGQTAENVALYTGISREDQDHWGVRSQNRAEDAIKSGFFEREIVPVTLPDGTIVTTDDGPRAGTTYEKISQLKPVFRPNGTITAGNACPLNDGAAAVVIMSDTKAKELGLTPLARIVSTGVSGLSPEIMGLGPIEAIKKALAKAGKKISDIDLVEINEAFAVQVLGSARELGIDEDKLNVSGGAIALGHPFGMTGARITATLLNNLSTYDKTFGIESMCVGGGQGMAMVVERLSLGCPLESAVRSRFATISRSHRSLESRAWRTRRTMSGLRWSATTRIWVHPRRAMYSDRTRSLPKRARSRWSSPSYSTAIIMSSQPMSRK